MLSKILHLYGGKERRLRVRPSSSLLAWGNCRWAEYKWGILCDWLGVSLCLFLVGPKLEAGQKLGKVVMKSWSSWSDRYRNYCAAFWFVANDSSRASCKSDLTQAGILGCWVGSLGCLSEFHFYRWFGHCLLVCSVLSWYTSLQFISVYLENDISLYGYTTMFIHPWAIHPSLDPSFLPLRTLLQFRLASVCARNVSYHEFPAICLFFWFWMWKIWWLLVFLFGQI